MPSVPIIQSAYNAYGENVQGKSNEPICVACIHDRARRRGLAPTNLLSDCTDAAHGVVPLAVAELTT
jgi:hypothetical protein